MIFFNVEKLGKLKDGQNIFGTPSVRVFWLRSTFRISWVLSLRELGGVPSHFCRDIFSSD